MFKFATAAALSLAAVAVPTAAAQAQVWQGNYAPAWGERSDGYVQEARYRNNNRRYYNNRRSSQRCYDKGNGGLAIGGIVGALAGREIAGRGDRTLGTLLGAGAGALAGRAIDKSDGRRC